MNPRAWIVTKQGMTGDLYEALAWDNGGSDGFPVEVRFMSTTMEFQTWGWRK